MAIRTEVADILRGADILSVAADQCELESTPEVVNLANFAAAEAYEKAGDILEHAGHANNAREAFEKAKTHYIKSGSYHRRDAMTRRSFSNPPPNGNYY